MARTAYSCLHVRKRICKPNRASLDRRGDIKKRNAHCAALPDIAADLTSQGSVKFWLSGLIFRGRRRRFVVSQNLALLINICSPRAFGFPLLIHNILVVLPAVDVNPVLEYFRFLVKT